MSGFSEADVEAVALEWLAGVGWSVAHPAELLPGTPEAERDGYDGVVLRHTLRDSLARLNPWLGPQELDDVMRALTRPQGAGLEARNRAFHRMLVDGVTVGHRGADGGPRWEQARVIDFDDPESNTFLASDQFIVVENEHRRRLDIVLFVNGLPLGAVELKNPADADATIWKAWRQLQTYKSELPTLFSMNEALVVSDGIQARIGTLTAGREWFKRWGATAGEAPADAALPELRALIEGALEPARLVALVRDFIVFEDDGSGRLHKKLAGYHQFHAVRAAVDETLRAADLQHPGPGHGGADGRGLNEAFKLGHGGEHGRREHGGADGRGLDLALSAADTRHKGPGRRRGDRRIGVVWHTQGAGKSLTMAFYAGAVIRHPQAENPTVVVLTDRNDLDDQLFATFSRCQDLLRQPPAQAASRADLRARLSVAAGGVVFTTIQKFLPEAAGDTRPALSQRRNIVVIADEAHRSQYDFIDGFARHMRDALPNASFVGFTGTPIEHADANTRAVFGEYISVYDIARAVADGATVPIYYESRLARLALDDRAAPSIDADFEEVTEGEEAAGVERLKTRWAQLEAVAGASERIGQVAADVVEHFDRRLEALDGKAMVVGMSRRICVDLYRRIVELRPEWHHDDDARGRIKVVMTGSASDPVQWQPHIRNKSRREALAARFRDPDDPLRMVLVRDMWLTGFDAPSLHTMYVDKPMRGHGLMQAIARVNRVFKDKPGGLVVDYLGLAHDLKQALAAYARGGGAGDAAIDQAEAVAVLQEKHEVCCGLFHGFDRSGWADGAPAARLALLPAAQEHILTQPDGKDRCLKEVRDLTKAFALAVPHPETRRIRGDVAFFQAVRSALAKQAHGPAPPGADADLAIRQIVSRAVTSEGVVDIFAAAGLDRPDISVLSEEFLAEVAGMPHRNLAVELLQKLLKGELAVRRRRNVVQARSFSEMLEQTLLRYRNRTIEAAQVVEELIALAREMQEAHARGERLGLDDDELAFYDALGANDSAVQVLGDETLRTIARELTDKVRANATIDWTVRENVRARLRVLVKRTLNRYGYPPDRQEQATATVLEQAETLSETWTLSDSGAYGRGRGPSGP